MVMWALPTVLGAALLVGAGASQAVAAPITFNTALPVSDEEVLLRQQIHYTHASDRLAGTLRD
ncbi:MAG TPA: hypothetical protein ENJ46_02115, partial [Hellea balneolensis]|nr:hypothetical protein [Hellea balneolensis]